MVKNLESSQCLGRKTIEKQQMNSKKHSVCESPGMNP